MTQFRSFDTVGKKEEVADIISNLTPTKTPFISQIGSEKVSNTLFQWQEDSLRAVQANAQVEGFTATSATLTPTTMRSNVTQILEKTIFVSGSVDAIDHYGRAKESAYQLSKAMAEVKRDLEHACVGTRQTQVVGNSTTARQFDGFQAQVAAAQLVATGGAATPLSENNLLECLQRLWAEGVDPSVLMVTAADARTVAGFAASAGRERDFSTGKKIVNAVDLYVSPFGEVKVQLNRFLNAGDSLIYDPDMWKLVSFRPWFRETLAKTGDRTMMMVVGEYSLKHKNRLASGIIRRQA
jgi:hypothetical protein